ncbi:MAG: ABC transporter substrate-binding protein [Oscillospiraceae bacterium]|nr:ABC transporter substrate-binding protein [Oscillospiraceae bacterium]
MKKTMRFLAALLCLMMLASCGAQPAESAPAAAPAEAGAAESSEASAEASAEQAQWQPLTVRDDLDREITLEAPPQRVAVLMGSFAETWLLAGGELIAAPKDAWEDFDLDLGESVLNLGSYQKVSVEALFDLEADLVIASANTKNQVELKDTLENARVNVLYFNVNGFEDYLRMLRVCADITGRDDLYEINGVQIQQQVEQAKAAAAAALESREAPRVLFIRTAASGIHVKGSEGTVLGLMLRDLGCVNVADGSDLLENLSMEKIIEEDPDLIFIVMQGSDQEGARKTLEDSLLSNPAWSGLSAVQAGKLFYMDKQLYHLKPNNRWGISYAELEKLLYEE